MPKQNFVLNVSPTAQNVTPTHFADGTPIAWLPWLPNYPQLTTNANYFAIEYLTGKWYDHYDIATDYYHILCEHPIKIEPADYPKNFTERLAALEYQMQNGTQLQPRSSGLEQFDQSALTSMVTELIANATEQFERQLKKMAEKIATFKAIETFADEVEAKSRRILELEQLLKEKSCDNLEQQLAN